MFDDDDDDDDDNDADSQRKGKRHVHYLLLKFTFNNLCIIYAKKPALFATSGL